MLLDEAVDPAAGGVYVAGANRPDAHLRGVQPGRDFAFETVDVRSVVAGDTVGGAAIRIEPAIEIGNIFKLGTRYSEPLGATYLDESGKAQLVWMGCYGFGPARAAAAAVEQYADEHGIAWPRAIAPFDVELVVLGKPGSDERAFADGLYGELQSHGPAGALRRPRRRTGGEVRRRRAARLPGTPDGRPPDAGGGRDRGSDPPRAGIAQRSDRGRRHRGRRAVAGTALTHAAVPGSGRRARRRVSPPITKRRLFGVDRSGPPPAATSSDQPLNPWTIPNAIGFVRLAAIPVFLVLALSSRDGQDTVATILFAVIGWADYPDGFAARLTGQYSRLGALLDPIVDRLLVISGMAVAFDFSLLPRWAIGVVVARELFMLALSRYGLSRGVELKINWPGRIGVAPTMAAPFLAMAGVHWLALIMLYIGTGPRAAGDRAVRSPGHRGDAATGPRTGLTGGSAGR